MEGDRVIKVFYESTPQAAARLGLSAVSGDRQIRKWCEDGKLPCRKVGGRWLVEAGAEPSVRRRPKRRKDGRDS